MHQLGHHYIDGTFSNGTPDYETARIWYEKAAEAVDVPSMQHIGDHYANGSFNGGVPIRKPHFCGMQKLSRRKKLDTNGKHHTFILI